MKESDRSLMIGIIGLAIVVIFGLWWFSSTSSGGGEMASTTPQVTTSGVKAPVVSASTEVPAKPAGVVSTASGLSLGKYFAALLNSTGVAAELSGAGPYTIFVPTDGAFARAGASVSGLSAAELKRLVEYHVIVGKAIDAHANIAGVVTALSKDPLNFTTNADKSVSVNSSKIVDTHMSTNGVVYTIDSLLIPPQINPAFQIK